METKSHPNMVRLFKKCHALESCAAEIYRHLAELHQSDPPLSRLFEKTAGEEDNHAAQFDMAQRLYLRNAACNIDLDESRIDGILATARSTLEEMRNNPPSPVEALKNAVMLEQVFSDFHVHTAVHFEDRSVQKLFRAMMAADQEHNETLEKALVEYSRS